MIVEHPIQRNILKIMIFERPIHKDIKNMIFEHPIGALSGQQIRENDTKKIKMQTLHFNFVVPFYRICCSKLVKKTEQKTLKCKSCILDFCCSKFKKTAQKIKMRALPLKLTENIPCQGSAG